MRLTTRKSKHITYHCLLLLIFICSFSCKVSHVFLRDNQHTNQSNNDAVVRIYLDRFGGFYPSVDVPINKKVFENSQFLKSKLKDARSFNLEYYFSSNTQRLSMLRQAYRIAAGTTPLQDFKDVQARIIDGYAQKIKTLATAGKAGIIIFLIHGFNEPNPELPNKYPLLRETINSNQQAAWLNPVYIEIYWDGLNAFGYKTLPVAKIWKPAQFNSRWIGLSLRNFIDQIQVQVHLPLAFVTHSLGASIATGALFNNTSKWDSSQIDQATQKKFNELMKIPTPVAEVKLGMLAPAIPGTTTFMDFNNRSPSNIRPSQNNISNIIIGYDPFDYATSKGFFRLASLAPFAGSTTLGCNYYSLKTRYTEIEALFDTMHQLGYPDAVLKELIWPIRFNTGRWRGTGGNDQHFMEYYIKDTLHSKLFFQELFK